MYIGATGGSTPYAASQAAQKPQGSEETTTVSTKPAPKAGENVYLLDETV